PALSDGKRDRWGARRRLGVARMLLAPPVLHDEAEFVGVEKQPLRVARSRRSQVDQEDDWELETLRGVDREQRDGVGTGCLLGRDLRLHFGKPGVPGFVETVAQSHASLVETA